MDATSQAGRGVLPWMQSVGTAIERDISLSAAERRRLPRHVQCYVVQHPALWQVCQCTPGQLAQTDGHHRSPCSGTPIPVLVVADAGAEVCVAGPTYIQLFGLSKEDQLTHNSPGLYHINGDKVAHLTWMENAPCNVCSLLGQLVSSCPCVLVRGWAWYLTPYPFIWWPTQSTLPHKVSLLASRPTRPSVPHSLPHPLWH